MKPVYQLAFVVLLATQLGFASEKVRGKITKVVDGDTIHFHADAGGKDLKIRMLGMDTPETHFPWAGKMYDQGKYAQVAAEEMEKLAPVGSDAELASFGLDKYKRTLGTVYVNHTDINLAIVEKGYAVPYVLCEKAECTPDYYKVHNVEAYVRGCQNAVAKGLGMHNAKDALTEAPYEFRARVRKQPFDKYVGDFDRKVYYNPANYKKVPVCNRVFFFHPEEAESAGFTKAND